MANEVITIVAIILLVAALLLFTIRMIAMSGKFDLISRRSQREDPGNPMLQYALRTLHGRRNPQRLSRDAPPAYEEVVGRDAPPPIFVVAVKDALEPPCSGPPPPYTECSISIQDEQTARY